MVFRVPKIKTCCCCMSLLTGSYVIAVLNVMAFIFMLGYGLHLRVPWHFYQIALYDTVLINIGAFAFYLIYGLKKADPTLIFPWILQMSVFAVFIFNSLFSNLVYLGLMDHRPDLLAVDLIGLAITCYCVLVVYNHYRVLKESSTENNFTSTNFAVSTRNVSVDN